MMLVEMEGNGASLLSFHQMLQLFHGNTHEADSHFELPCAAKDFFSLESVMQPPRRTCKSTKTTDEQPRRRVAMEALNDNVNGFLRVIEGM